MRTLNAGALALLTRLQAGEPIPVVQLVELMLASPQRFTNAGREISWNSLTWTPLGLAIEPIEDATAEWQGISLVLPGVSSAQLALALTEDTDGKIVRVYDALVDPSTGVVADAALAWVGTMDAPSIEDGPTATVTIQCEHRATTAVRAKPFRYTNSAQQSLFAGDTSLDADPKTDAAQIVWPAASFWREE